MKFKNPKPKIGNIYKTNYPRPDSEVLVKFIETDRHNRPLYYRCELIKKEEQKKDADADKKRVFLLGLRNYTLLLRDFVDFQNYARVNDEEDALEDEDEEDESDDGGYDDIF
jgi:hypothetical protein